MEIKIKKVKRVIIPDRVLPDLFRHAQARMANKDGAPDLIPWKEIVRQYNLETGLPVPLGDHWRVEGEWDYDVAIEDVERIAQEGWVSHAPTDDAEG